MAIRARKSSDGTVSYQLVVYAGRDGAGRDEYVRRTLTGVSKREATRAHAQLVVDVQQGRTGPSRSLTVAEMADQWWAAHAPELSPSTRIGYRGWLDSRVLPQFGSRRISSVTTADVERWYGQLRDGPKPLGIRSIRGCRTVLSAIFSTAVRWGYLPVSPVERARLPRAPKWTPRAPMPEQVAARIALADERDVDLGVFARMAVALGARRGELVALRWSDVDLDHGLVTIGASVVQADVEGTGRTDRGAYTSKDTKTHAERKLALDPGTIEALRAMRVRRVETALACGLSLPTDAYLWSDDPDGRTPRSPNRCTYDWIQIDRAADDGAHVRFHDLRHYHGTMLVGAGVPIASVRDRLGHSSLTVTNIYVDGRPEWDRRSAEIMGGLLDGPDSSAPVGTAQ